MTAFSEEVEAAYDKATKGRKLLEEVPLVCAESAEVAPGMMRRVELGAHLSIACCWNHLSCPEVALLDETLRSTCPYAKGY